MNCGRCDNDDDDDGGGGGGGGHVMLVVVVEVVMGRDSTKRLSLVYRVCFSPPNCEYR